MKRLLLLAAVLTMCMTGVARADVIVANSLGEPDSNRPGEDLPEWFDADGTLSVDTTDTAGAGSTASAKVTGTTEGSLYNDHYDDEDWPMDVSCCATYVNFYIKSSVDVTFMDSWCSSYDWSDEFNLADWSDDLVTGEWNYISIAIADAASNTGWDPAGYDTHGVYWELAEEGDLWFDHWTFSSTPEEGELGEPEPPPPAISISGSGHRLLVGQDLDLAVDPGDIEPTAYQWAKDGEDLEGETESTLTILSVTTDDTGDYSCLVTYEEEGGDAAYAEAEPSYYVWVTETALPLAGGLGLGLLAGACALAGVVAIGRKK